MSYRDHLPETEGYGRLVIAINAVVAIGGTLALLWVITDFTPFYEQIFRVAPVADGANAGIGADWTSGNQIAWLDFSIALVHAVDVIAGVGILFMVFLHWGIFRRLAARMDDSGPTRSEALAADGGRDGAEGAAGPTEPTDGDRGGERR